MCSWAAELADVGALTHSTLRSYVAGLGSWFDENRDADNHAPNPAQSIVLRKVLNGIERAQAERKQARPLASAPPDTQPLLFTTLQQLHFASTARDRMLKAAAYIGVAAALRPAELLGNYHAPERALLREQLTFYSDAAASVVVSPPGTGATPRFVQITLRVTKTSQFNRVIKFVQAADAVEAAWRWFCETADRHPRTALFRLLANPAAPRLSTYALTRDLTRRHAAAGLGDIRLTGKSWRMGGASTLAIQGYDAADIAALGWAPESAQWQRYARDPQAVRQHALARSTLMQPRSPAAGAAAAASLPERRRAAPAALL